MHINPPNTENDTKQKMKITQTWIYINSFGILTMLQLLLATQMWNRNISHVKLKPSTSTMMIWWRAY
jgi:hypothetical protein